MLGQGDAPIDKNGGNGRMAALFGGQSGYLFRILWANPPSRFHGVPVYRKPTDFSTPIFLIENSIFLVIALSEPRGLEVEISI